MYFIKYVVLLVSDNNSNVHLITFTRHFMSWNLTYYFF